MTAPDRIAAHWTAGDEDTPPSQMLTLTPRSPSFREDMPKSTRVEYVRADLATPAAMTPEVRAEDLARLLFPDDYHDGSDCMDEVGREGQPCNICAERSRWWKMQVQHVADALAALREGGST